uniref:Uncharacterized protein n=1 Tax=Cucumis sativus TaxID=3659 RepID=A0A0A0K0Q7_CUCSA
MAQTSSTNLWPAFTVALVFSSFINIAFADSPYRFFDWNVTYGDIYPLGVRQQGILINGQFPGPDIYAVTNDNIYINVHNSLPEPFLLSWNGVQQRKNSYQDGVYGTTCPIPPGQNFTYRIQVKDQIGSYFYFPSLAFHKAAGGFGSIRVLSRPLIPVPFPEPAADYTLLIGDWYTANHTTLKTILDRGHKLPFPNGIVINGRGPNATTFTVEKEVEWSINQARSIRTNLTASGPRPNPQGSYHYGLINISRTIKLESSAALVSRKQRYAVNSVSFIPADTPLKLADYFGIDGVFSVGSVPDVPSRKPMYLDTSVMGADYRAFIEIVFQNHENIVQSWHIDGYSFWVVGMDGGVWTPASREQYNLRDAVSRCTTQVYPKSWTAIYMSLDNVGMWNIRSEFWARQYLGQQFYLRVYTPVKSFRDEYNVPDNALLCGKAEGKSTASP